MRLKKIFWGLVFSAFFIGFCPPCAQAVQIEHVYSGIVNFDLTDTLNSATLPAAVNTSKSIILLSQSVSSNTNGDYDENRLFIAQFVGNSTVLIERAAATTQASVSYQVVEFSDGVNVQSGIADIPQGSTSASVNIAYIPTVKNSTIQAIPILQGEASDKVTTDTEDFFVIPTLQNNGTSSATLTLTRSHATTTKNTNDLIVAYQVVEFQYDATVQTGTTSLTEPGGTVTNQIATATLSPALSAVNNSLLFYYLNPGTYFNSSSDADAEMFTMGSLTNTTTASFERQYATHNTDCSVAITYYVVDFNNGTSGLGAGTQGIVAVAAPALTSISTDTDATPSVITTSTTETYATGNLVNIEGLTTLTPDNGNFFITYNSTTSFSLNGTATTGYGTDSGVGKSSTVPAASTINVSGTITDLQRSLYLLSVEGGSSSTVKTIVPSLSFQGDLGVGAGSNNTLWFLRDGSSTALTSTNVAYSAYQFPSVSLRAPNASGQTLVIGPSGVGTPYNITWQAADDVTSVNLSYYCGSNPGGGTYTSIASGVTCTGTGGSCGGQLNSYSWNVGYNSGGTAIWPTAEMNTSNCYVKVANGSVDSYYSENPFTMQSQLVLTAPTGGQNWLVGQSQSITWSAYGNFGSTVSLQYALSPYTSWTTMTTPTSAATLSPTAGSYSWTIPSTAEGTIEVRVISNDQSSIYSVSPSLTIGGYITVTAPITSTTWETGYTNNITWTLESNSTLVDLSYSTDAGNTWHSIATSQSASSGTYAWTTPIAAISNNAQVLVVDHSNSSITGQGPPGAGVFTITPSITVNTPASGAVWLVGNSQNITWTLNGAGITSVNLSYSTNSGSTWTSITTGVSASLGTYAWTIPNAPSTTSNQDEVEVVNAANSSVVGYSSLFTILGQITNVSPNGGLVLSVGASQSISWTSQGMISGDNLTLKYDTNGGGNGYNNTITTVAASTSSYGWTVPNAISTNVLVKVVSVDNSSVYGVSPSAFSIEPALTLTAPTAGSTLYVGNSTNITWTYGGTVTGNFELMYSTNGGSTYPNNINTSIAQTGSPQTYSWTVPDAIGTAVVVKVALANTPTVYSTSSTGNPITIKGILTLTNPTSSSNWEVGSTTNSITWTKTGTMPSPGTVNLAYDTNGGANSYNNPISTNSVLASALSYSWTIPNAIGNAVSVKVSLYTDPTVNSASANFSIIGGFSIITPAAGAIWLVNTQDNITWNIPGQAQQ